MNSIIVYNSDFDFEDKLKEAADGIRQGKLVAFPTETVYGLGANAFDDMACKKIYEAKGRPSDNPLIVHVSGMDMANKLCRKPKMEFMEIAEAFWPGPISFVLNKSEIVCDTVSAGLDTVALRMPNNLIALSLIREAKVPIAAPSANISGRPSPTRSEHVIFDLKDKIDYIICQDEFPIGVESTVLDLSSDVPVILRPGAISPAMIELKTGIRVEGNFMINENERPKAPGMKYKHYSPKARVYAVTKEFNLTDLEDFAKSKGSSVSKAKFIEYENDVEMAKNLFADFREADKNNYEIVVIKPAYFGELLEANLNRLNKASEKD